jgi:hypothetical protein
MDSVQMSQFIPHSAAAAMNSVASAASMAAYFKVFTFLNILTHFLLHIT